MNCNNELLPVVDAVTSLGEQTTGCGHQYNVPHAVDYSRECAKNKNRKAVKAAIFETLNQERESCENHKQYK